MSWSGSSRGRDLGTTGGVQAVGSGNGSSLDVIALAFRETNVLPCCACLPPLLSECVRRCDFGPSVLSLRCMGTGRVNPSVVGVSTGANVLLPV